MVFKSKAAVTKTFVTIVPHSENLELRKDPGQIPYHAHKVLGFDSTLVTFYYSLEKGRSGGAMTPPIENEQIHKDYPFLKTEVDGLKIHFLQPKGRKSVYEITISEYIKTQAKKIDVLSLIHFGSENIYYCFLYKFYNPQGKIYLKLDIDIDFYQTFTHIFQFSKRFFLGVYIEKIVLFLFFKIINVISAESSMGLQYFKKRFAVPIKKLILLPNGVDEERIGQIVPLIKKYNEKENIILTVGRIGNFQKNNEMLMEAVASVDLEDWKVFFVGPIEKGFDKVIRKYFITHPKLINKVFFTDKVSNPIQLYEYYNKAKVFCLTSRFEGFPLVCCEAAFMGNYQLLSDEIYAFDTLTNGGEFGAKFTINNVSKLVELITKIIEGDLDISLKCSEINKYANENLTWQNNIQKLKKFI